MRLAILLTALAVGSSWAWPLLAARAPTVDDAAVAPERFASAELSLRDHLSEAKVTWGDDAGLGFTGQRWVSGLQPWLWVGPYRGLATTARGPEWRRCIWAHAAGPATGPKARPIRIRFDDLPPFTRVHGEAAILDVPREGGPLDFSVTVGTQRPVRRVLTDARGERQWTAWEAINVDGARSVTFEIAAASPDWRQFCFTAHLGQGLAP